MEERPELERIDAGPAVVTLEVAPVLEVLGWVRRGGLSFPERLRHAIVVADVATVRDHERSVVIGLAVYAHVVGICTRTYEHTLWSKDAACIDARSVWYVDGEPSTTNLG